MLNQTGNYWYKAGCITAGFVAGKNNSGGQPNRLLFHWTFEVRTHPVFLKIKGKEPLATQVKKRIFEKFVFPSYFCLAVFQNLFMLLKGIFKEINVCNKPGVVVWMVWFGAP